MTKQEATIIEAYTGITMLNGDDRYLLYAYTEKLFGHPVTTGDFSNPDTWNKLKELSKADFLSLCENLVE